MVRLIGAALVLLLTASAVAATGGGGPPGEIRDIRGPLPLARLFPWLPPAGALLVLAGGAASLLLVAGRRQRRDARLPLSPAPSPAEALALLERRFAAGGEELPLLYAELAGVVRLSLKERTGLPALRLTTEELFNGIAAREDVVPEEAGRIRSFLLRCDLVKFAGAAPTGGDIAEDLAAARAIITTAGEPRRHGDTEEESLRNSKGWTG